MFTQDLLFMMVDLKNCTKSSLALSRRGLGLDFLVAKLCVKMMLL